MEAQNISEKPNLYTYHDYLSYLRDHLDCLKKSPLKTSLRTIAEQAGIPPSLLAMTLAGKRKMTERVFSKLIITLNLNKTERQVLKLLRLIAESEVSLERTEALEELQKIPEYKKYNKNSTLVFQYLSNWLNVAIREMLFLKDFKEDVLWIKNRLRGNISSREIAASLEFLKSNGYAKYNTEGQLINTEPHLDCSEGVFKISLGEFHRQMFQLAESSIEEIEREFRLILGHTFSIDKSNLSEVKNILQDTMRKLESLSRENLQKPTDVYHVEVALFPMTQPESQEGESYE